MHSGDNRIYYLDTPVKLVDVHNLTQVLDFTYLNIFYKKGDYSTVNRLLDMAYESRKAGYSKYYFYITTRRLVYKKLAAYSIIKFARWIDIKQKNGKKDVYNKYRKYKYFREIGDVNEDVVIRGILEIYELNNTQSRISQILEEKLRSEYVILSCELYAQLYLSKKLGLLDKWL